MTQRIVDLLISLIAPPKNASAEELRRHAVTLSFAVAMVYVHIAIACGWASSIGLSGFALATTVEQMQREDADFRVSFYAIGIREFHHSYCNASNYQDQSLLNDQLERLRAGYQKEVGVPYVLPPCPGK